MAAGIPLNDADREPWLKQIGQWLADRPEGAMVGCSALKRKYRDLIREYCPGVVFVHVHGDFDVLYERMQHRPGHFMPASLLQSQFDTSCCQGVNAPLRPGGSCDALDSEGC